MSEVRAKPKTGASFTTFIQWKGTNLCMDFNCPDCGEHSHFDGFFAYNVQCGVCGARWEMPTDVQVKRAAPDATPVLLEGEEAPQ